MFDAAKRIAVYNVVSTTHELLEQAKTAPEISLFEELRSYEAELYELLQQGLLYNTSAYTMQFHKIICTIWNNSFFAEYASKSCYTCNCRAECTLRIIPWFIAISDIDTFVPSMEMIPHCTLSTATTLHQMHYDASTNTLLSFADGTMLYCW